MTKPDSHYSDIATERCAEQDKQREEFEAWCLYKHFHPTANTTIDWECWQAAQAAMRLEIDKNSFMDGDTYDLLQHEIKKLAAANLELAAQVEFMREALRCYAECSDGCTCGDGWSHTAAQEALAIKPSEALAEYRKKVRICSRVEATNWLQVEYGVTIAENFRKGMAEEKS